MVLIFLSFFISYFSVLRQENTIYLRFPSSKFFLGKCLKATLVYDTTLLGFFNLSIFSFKCFSLLSFSQSVLAIPISKVPNLANLIFLLLYLSIFTNSSKFFTLLISILFFNSFSWIALFYSADSLSILFKQINLIILINNDNNNDYYYNNIFYILLKKLYIYLLLSNSRSIGSSRVWVLFSKSVDD